MARYVYSASAASAPALDVVATYDFTLAANLDVSSAGAHTVNDSSGDLICTLTTGTEATAPTTVDADMVLGSGLVVNLETTSDARDFVFHFPLPTSGIDLDIDMYMIEMIFKNVTLTASSNNSTMSWGLSTSGVMNGSPFYGMLLKNTASNMYWTIRRKNSASSNDSAATIDTGRISGETVHMQIIGTNRGAYIVKDSGTAFVDPYPSSPTMSGTTGSNSVNAAAGAPSIWSSPTFICKNYLRYSGNRWQFTLEKVRICRFSPYSS